MKYSKKILPADEELKNKLESEGWAKLKEPSNLGMVILFSIPFMFINGAISLFIAFYLYPPLQEIFKIGYEPSFSFTVNFFTLILVVVMLLFLTLHEFLHACFIPNVLKSDKTYWGFNGFVGFVYTFEKIKRNRFLIISIMPFFLISIVLPFILNIFGWLNGYTIFLCLLNAMGSCADCLSICLVAIQVPNGAYIINNGFETYFK